MLVQSPWYLVRTKPNRERLVSRQLTRFAPEVFLPLLSRTVEELRPNGSAAPLFPQYLFLRCDIRAHYFRVRYAPGVVSFVAAGRDPLSVPETIIESIRERCTNGVVHLRQKPFRKGEPVQILDGPFRGFEAVFERYLSGAVRVAILLNAVEGYNVRVIANAQSIDR